MWFRLLNLFRRYRHEGIPTAIALALPDPEDPEEAEEPYDHPYEIPKDRRGVIAVYGDCGVAKLDPKWERANMVLIEGLPGRWNGSKGRIYCHRKAAPAIREALRRCALYGVLDEVEKIGCFNWRHVQHNSAKPLSYHSWGIAFDVNPADNKLRRYKRGTAPKPWSPEWWEVWPNGVSEKLVQAFKEAGLAWGGDWQTVPDPMHFQLVG